MLIAAAILKLAGWNVSAFAQYGWLLTPNIRTVILRVTGTAVEAHRAPK